MRGRGRGRTAERRKAAFELSLLLSTIASFPQTHRAAGWRVRV
jgi:hypothetical protein